MEEKMLFSTELSGYKKAEVIEYIGKMDRNAQTKIKELERQLENSKKRIEQLELELNGSKPFEDIDKANAQAKKIIDEANAKALEIVEASQNELKQNLAKTKYLYNRRDSVKKELLQCKATVDKLFSELDLEAE